MHDVLTIIKINAQWPLPYNIKGSVATLKAMPTPFCFFLIRSDDWVTIIMYTYTS